MPKTRQQRLAESAATGNAPSPPQALTNESQRRRKTPKPARKPLDPQQTFAQPQLNESTSYQTSEKHLPSMQSLPSSKSSVQSVSLSRHSGGLNAGAAALDGSNSSTSVTTSSESLALASGPDAYIYDSHDSAQALQSVVSLPHASQSSSASSLREQRLSSLPLTTHIMTSSISFLPSAPQSSMPELSRVRSPLDSGTEDGRSLRKHAETDDPDVDHDPNVNLVAHVTNETLLCCPLSNIDENRSGHSLQCSSRSSTYGLGSTRAKSGCYSSKCRTVRQPLDSANGTKVQLEPDRVIQPRVRRNPSRSCRRRPAMTAIPQDDKAPRKKQDGQRRNHQTGDVMNATWLSTGRQQAFQDGLQRGNRFTLSETLQDVHSMLSKVHKKKESKLIKIAAPSRASRDTQLEDSKKRKLQQLAEADTAPTPTKRSKATASQSLASQPNSTTSRRKTVLRDDVDREILMQNHSLEVDFPATSTSLVPLNDAGEDAPFDLVESARPKTVFERTSRWLERAEARRQAQIEQKEKERRQAQAIESQIRRFIQNRIRRGELRADTDIDDMIRRARSNPQTPMISSNDIEHEDLSARADPSDSGHQEPSNAGLNDDPERSPEMDRTDSSFENHAPSSQSQRQPVPETPRRGWGFSSLVPSSVSRFLPGFRRSTIPQNFQTNQGQPTPSAARATQKQYTEQEVQRRIQEALEAEKQRKAAEAAKAQQAHTVADDSMQVDSAPPSQELVPNPSKETEEIPNPPGVSYGMDLRYFAADSSDEEELEEMARERRADAQAKKRKATTSAVVDSDSPSNKRPRRYFFDDDEREMQDHGLGDPHRARPYTGTLFADPNSSQQGHLFRSQGPRKSFREVLEESEQLQRKSQAGGQNAAASDVQASKSQSSGIHGQSRSDVPSDGEAIATSIEAANDGSNADQPWLTYGANSDSGSDDEDAEMAPDAGASTTPTSSPSKVLQGTGVGPSTPLPQQQASASTEEQNLAKARASAARYTPKTPSGLRAASRLSGASQVSSPGSPLSGSIFAPIATATQSADTADPSTSDSANMTDAAAVSTESNFFLDKSGLDDEVRAALEAATSDSTTVDSSAGAWFAGEMLAVPEGTYLGPF